MPDFIGLVQYQTGLGIISFFHSSARLIGCRTVWHFGICTHAHTPPCTHTHGQASRTWTYVMDMEMDKHRGCWNADKMFSPHH
jgi:hypothetical protein